MAKGKNIIPTESSLPAYFGLGLAVNLFYLVLLFFFCYYRFNRYLFPKTEKGVTFKDLEYNFQSGTLLRLDIFCEKFRDQLLNLFFGRVRGFDGNLSLDGKSIATPVPKDVAYLPNPEKLPGSIKVSSLLSLAGVVSEDGFPRKGRLMDLTKNQKIKLLLSLVGPLGRKIYIFDDFHSPRNKDSISSEEFAKLQTGEIFILDMLLDSSSLVIPNKFLVVSRIDNHYECRSKI